MDAQAIERLARQMQASRPPEDPDAGIDAAELDDLLDVFLELWPDGGRG
jgi:hypothetical protein